MSESKVTDAAKDIAGKAFDKMQDSAAPLSTALMNRFGSPVFYSFLVSWALINWERIAITIAGTGELEKRITVAKELPSTFFGVEHATTYYIPLFSTLIIVFVSPYINLIVDKFHTAAFRQKYIHTATLEAQRYNADTSALSAKVGYSMAEEQERLKIDAENIENRSRIEIAELNLNTAKQNLKQLNEATKIQRKHYEDGVQLLEKITESISTENDKLKKISIDVSAANETLDKLNEEIIHKRANINKLSSKESIARLGLGSLILGERENKDSSSHKN